MLRKATIQIETKLTQEEFEVWLLNLIKTVAVDPEKSSILKNHTIIEIRKDSKKCK